MTCMNLVSKVLEVSEVLRLHLSGVRRWPPWEAGERGGRAERLDRAAHEEAQRGRGLQSSAGQGQVLFMLCHWDAGLSKHLKSTNLHLHLPMLTELHLLMDDNYSQDKSARWPSCEGEFTKDWPREMYGPAPEISLQSGPRHCCRMH